MSPATIAFACGSSPHRNRTTGFAGAACLGVLEVGGQRVECLDHTCAWHSLGVDARCGPAGRQRLQAAGQEVIRGVDDYLAR